MYGTIQCTVDGNPCWYRLVTMSLGEKRRGGTVNIGSILEEDKEADSSHGDNVPGFYDLVDLCPCITMISYTYTYLIHIHTNTHESSSRLSFFLILRMRCEQDWMDGRSTSPSKGQEVHFRPGSQRRVVLFCPSFRPWLWEVGTDINAMQLFLY